MDSLPSFNENTIVECFGHLHNPLSSSIVRKQADTYLMDCEKHLVPLLKVLMAIFQNLSNTYNLQIRLQSLLYLSNVIKRNWNNKRLLKSEKELPQLKKFISAHLIAILEQGEKVFQKSLFDLIGFIAKFDYPHAFGELTSYTLTRLANIKADEENVRIFKALRDVFLQLAERKGFANHRNYEEGPLRVLGVLGPITEGLRVQMCKGGDINPQIARVSKYCDQMMIGLMRIAPYSYLDDQNFMLLIRHLNQKLQTLLTAHCQQSNANKELLEKDIKSLVYQLGCLQVVNPCIMGQVLSDYITTIFYLLSKPLIFVKPACVKYSLLSMRKVIKQFAYYSESPVFEKSISPQSRSQNYMQLRNLASEAYRSLITEDTVQGLFNFLLTTIMSIKSKEDDGLTLAFDGDGSSATGYQKSTEKEMSLHLCGVLLVESLIERFPQKMLSLIYSSLQTCIENNWTGMDCSTLQNFLSIMSILPRSCKKVYFQQLSQFPIIKILQFVHGSENNKVRQKFPVLVSGWLQVFSNEQLGQLIEALLGYVLGGAQTGSMEILIYSCQSLNKIVRQRVAAIDCGAILNTIFPISIKVFQQTDNPEILWPLITLISDLLTKCQFDSSVIISSIQQNALASLISNESQMLVEALSEMFKSFLCIIPRNKPAIAVFKLVYQFLNTNLSKTQSQAHEKCVILWYYSVREFSQANQCNEEYNELFENHYRRCLPTMKPILVYILEEYMLLGLIQSKLDAFVNIVLEFYKQGEFLETSDQGNREQGTNLKIAALSFHITLITKYNIEKVNSQEMLSVIIKDFCTGTVNKNISKGNSSKAISGTLQNSLLSIINRYIIHYPDYFFHFVFKKMAITPPIFYDNYFQNMEHLTSRTAIKINSLALLSLLPSVKAHFNEYDTTKILLCLFTILKINHAKLGLIGQNAGNIQNSPNIRFSQTIMSQRKEAVRKLDSYQNVEIKRFFVQNLLKTMDLYGTNSNELCQLMEKEQAGQNWGYRLNSLLM